MSDKMNNNSIAGQHPAERVNAAELEKLHFLVSISAETESLNGVRFLCSFMGAENSCDITLFHILSPASNSSAALTEMWDNPHEQIEGKLTATTRRALEKAKGALHSSDILHHMKTKTVKEQYGKVKDILTEGANGLYDAMVLGRRATYALQWMFDRPADEIPQALIRDASLSSPLWICSEPEEGRSNVLLCLDGSTSSLRMADHVGYILNFAKRHHVTLFHVSPTVTGDGDRILEEGAEILAKHSIAPQRIHRKSAWGLSVINTILSEKSSGKYAAVAVGLHGSSSKGVLDTLGVVGKTTSTLITKISKAALWCCP